MNKQYSRIVIFALRQLLVWSSSVRFNNILTCLMVTARTVLLLEAEGEFWEVVMGSSKLCRIFWSGRYTCDITENRTAVLEVCTQCELVLMPRTKVNIAAGIVSFHTRNIHACVRLRLLHCCNTLCLQHGGASCRRQNGPVYWESFGTISVHCQSGTGSPSLLMKLDTGVSN